MASISPATTAQLERYLPRSEINLIARAYDFLAEKNEAGELKVAREVDASFNARPSRILQIALIEGQLRTSSALVVSLLASAQDDHSLLDWNTPSEQKAALLIRSFIGGEDVELSEEQLDIAGAILLDEIRHMHMSTLPYQSRSHRLDQLVGLVSKLQPTRLKIKCDASLQRQLKIIKDLS